MSLRLELSRGGDAELLSSDGALAAISSSVPSPPGSTLEGRASDFPQLFALKVKHCKKQPDGRFRIDGKWVNLSREQRARVLAG